MKFDTDEIITIKIGKKLSRKYKGYKGTFATLVYNCVQQKALPGFYDEKDLVVGAEQEGKTLSVTFSGNRQEDALMDIMDIALSNVSAFPVDAGKAEFSIHVK